MGAGKRFVSETGCQWGKNGISVYLVRQRLAFQKNIPRRVVITVNVALCIMQELWWSLFMHYLSDQINESHFRVWEGIWMRRYVRTHSITDVCRVNSASSQLEGVCAILS